MKNLFVRLAAGAVIACAIFPSACSRDDRTFGPAAPKAEVGTMKMRLQTTSESGKVYRLRQAQFPVTSFCSSNTTTLSSETDPTKSVLEAFLNPCTYQIQLLDGWFVTQVDDLLGSESFVPATLLSSPFQVFDIQSDQETFVKFDFEVDGQRVGFGPPGRLIVGIGVNERGGNPGGLNPRRSLLETNLDAVSMITLEGALSAIERNSGLEPDPVTLYQRMIDTYASAPNGRIADAGHCGDETTDGVPSLNGYPLACDRLEHQQFDNFNSWFPLAAVNRVDLAPTDGAHCGQQRLIFSNNFPIGNSRMFMIVEAQIPNPNPGCGVAACRPIADFWASLSTIDDAKERGNRIAQAFLFGTSELSASGFGPFLSIENLGVGSGSIRTNNFDDFMWTLREFKVQKDSDRSRVSQFPVDSAPNGALWNDTQFLAAGEQCRANFLDALGGLLSDNPAEMAFIVDAPCLDAESPNNFSQSYPTHLSQGSGAFRSALEARLLGTGLTPEDIASRAQFAGSCIGCHSEANGALLGNGVSAPFSTGFVHVSEQFTEDCGDGTSCFGASSALKDVFLPRRLRAMSDLMAISCSGSDAGVSVDGGAAVDGGASVDGGAAVDAPPPPPPKEGGAFTASPPSPGGVFQRRTLGGQPVGVTH